MVVGWTQSVATSFIMATKKPKMEDGGLPMHLPAAPSPHPICTSQLLCLQKIASEGSQSGIDSHKLFLLKSTHVVVSWVEKPVAMVEWWRRILLAITSYIPTRRWSGHDGRRIVYCSNGSIRILPRWRSRSTLCPRKK